ncbi:MAG: 4Fe-4S dicluster domain-containing protein [bacterium]
MTSKQLKNFIKYLQKSNIVIGPKREDDNLIFDEIDDVENIELSNSIPLHSFKRFLLPNNEVLGCDGERIPPLAPPCKGGEKMIFFGITLHDLKAISILNHIFEKDLYYQNRKKNILTVGYISLPEEFKGNFAVHYEEDFLEHMQFDIFIVEEKEKFTLTNDKSKVGILRYAQNDAQNNEIKIFTGSREGQRVLDNFGYSNYENVQFAGLVKEEGTEPSIIKISGIMKKLNSKSKIFKDLGERCIECGRCSIICPLCYCFCLDDEHHSYPLPAQAGPQWGITSPLPSPKGEGVVRMRNLTSCFYSEFSEVAGGHKFLRNPAKRIFNWYEHKFARFPAELSVAGCVSCGRCAKVCPVGIDIKEVIKEILLIDKV